MGFDMKLAVAIGVTVAGAAAVDALTKSISTIGPESRKVEADAGGLGKSLSGIGSSIASFVGKAAAVLGITEAFSSLASAGFNANAALETSKLGVASLITAQADLVGAYNKTLAGTDALAAASDIAAGQMQKLKIAGLQTAATTNQLTAAFQQAVGAGLSAGLKLDQIRVLTVGITQAAGALGVPMEQLNQEIVSILAGTIDVNSRVAKSLGISNEMVASWKAQGTLATELGKKLAAFSVAGGEIAKTWAATKSNMSEAFSELARVVTNGSFEKVKAAMNNALSGMFNLQDATIATWLQPITDGLTRVFDTLGSVAANSIKGLVDGARAVAEWLDQNRIAVSDMGQSIVEMGTQLISIATTVSGLALSFADWAVQSGVVNVSLRATALLLAGFQDGVKFISNLFASLGADILEYLVKPVIGFNDLLAGKGWGGSAFYASLKDQIIETRAAVRGINADFENGRTSVGELTAKWKTLGETQQDTAKATGAAIDSAITVQARQGALTEKQKEMEANFQREKEKATLSATDFAIREAEREAEKKRLIAGGNAGLLAQIEEELRKNIQTIRDKADADRVDGESGVTSAIKNEISKRVGLEQNAASAVAAVWSQANAVKAAQTGGVIQNQGTPGEFVSSWDAAGNYVGDLGSSSSAPRGYAGGGAIEGPGTGTSDSILARVSSGEWIMRNAAVNHYGSSFMAAINSMTLPRFADGGPVGGSGSGGAGITIQNLNLPGITNARQFVAEIRQMQRTDPSLLSPSSVRPG